MSANSTASETGSGRGTQQPTPTKKLIVTLELEFRHLTDSEIDDGWEPEDDEDLASDDYTHDEVVRLLVNAIESEETQAEMFAGSGVFLKMLSVRPLNSSWGGSRLFAAAPDMMLALNAIAATTQHTGSRELALAALKKAFPEEKP